LGSTISRRQILSSGVAASLSRPHAGGAAPGAKSNVVLILADDLGINGHLTIRTPYLDRMCAEGVQFSNFYSAACVCTPSRAALPTGR